MVAARLGLFGTHIPGITWPSDGSNGRLTTRDLLKFRFDGERSAVNVHRVHHHVSLTWASISVRLVTALLGPSSTVPLNLLRCGAERHVRSTHTRKGRT